MRAITVPTPDTLDIRTGAVDKDGQSLTRRTSFYDFLADNVFADEKMGKKRSECLKNEKILAKFEGKSAGDVVLVEDEYADKLAAVAEEPSNGGWRNYFLRQLMPFVNAIAPWHPEENPGGAKPVEVTELKAVAAVAGI